MSDPIKDSGARFLSALFGSQAKACVLAELFGERAEETYIAQLVRRAGMAEQGIDQQLRNLLAIGLVVTRTDRSRRYYRANIEHPAYLALRQLVEGSVGVAPAVQSALAGPGIACAFIFGSMARGDHHATSDIDLFVIGDVQGTELSGRVRAIADRFGRELNYCLYTPAEFLARLADKNHFVATVLAGEKIFMVGDQAALDGLTN